MTTRSLRVQDHFAFTAQGRAWMKYFWLADILFYFIYAVARASRLILQRSSCVTAAFTHLVEILPDGNTG